MVQDVPKRCENINPKGRKRILNIKATHQKFTQSIFGWDAQEDGSLTHNWFEQNAIDFMAWQVNGNGMSATAVARFLNKKELKGKRGGKWHGSGVLRTIRNQSISKGIDFLNQKIGVNRFGRDRNQMIQSTYLYQIL